MQIPPIKKEDGTWTRNSKQKAQLFAEHLSNTFQPFPRQTVEENILSIQKKDSKEINFVTIKELITEIDENLSAKKNPGYDLITGQVLKELPKKGYMKLAFNKCCI